MFKPYLEYSGPSEKFWAVWDENGDADAVIGAIVLDRKAQRFTAYLGEDPPRKALGSVQENHETKGLKKAMRFFSMMRRVASTWAALNP